MFDLYHLKTKVKYLLIQVSFYTNAFYHKGKYIKNVKIVRLVWFCAQALSVELASCALLPKLLGYNFALIFGFQFQNTGFCFTFTFQTWYNIFNRENTNLFSIVHSFKLTYNITVDQTCTSTNPQFSHLLNCVMYNCSIVS